MAKRKKTKRRVPQKKTQRSEEPDEAFEADEAEASGDDGAEDAVDARFDDEDDEEAAAAPAAKEPASKPRGQRDRPVGPALDPGSPDARVSTSGGLWVMAVVFGLIAVAVVAQYLIG